MNRDKDYEFRKKKKIAENQKLLTAQQKEEIKKAFDFFDITGSGEFNTLKKQHFQINQACLESILVIFILH